MLAGSCYEVTSAQHEVCTCLCVCNSDHARVLQLHVHCVHPCNRSVHLPHGRPRVVKVMLLGLLTSEPSQEYSLAMSAVAASLGFCMNMQVFPYPAAIRLQVTNWPQEGRP
jgi:hypothetical protein